MADTLTADLPTPRRLGADAFFAGGIVVMLTILFLPIPPILIDLGLAFSIALSALYCRHRKYSGASELFRQARAAAGPRRRTEPSCTSRHSPSTRNWPRPPTTT